MIVQYREPFIPRPTLQAAAELAIAAAWFVAMVLTLRYMIGA